MSFQAGVAVFGFNRPLHLQKCLTQLARANGFASVAVDIYLDGPRYLDDEPNVKHSQKIAREFAEGHSRHCRGILVHVREENVGLYHAVVEGVSRTSDHYGAAIVLEDDLLAKPSLLTYLCAALEKYEDFDRVVQISAFAHDSKPNDQRGETAAAFLPLTTSWGWATWRDRWSRFVDWSSSECIESQSVVGRSEFDFNFAYPYSALEAMQRRGLVNSWAIKFHRFAMEQHGITLFPPISMVDNIGFDGSGRHCKQNRLACSVPTDLVPVLPDSLNIDRRRMASMRTALRGTLGSNYYPLRLKMAMKTAAHDTKTWVTRCLNFSRK